MLPIEKSPLAAYFDDLPPEDLVGLEFLDAGEAAEVWKWVAKGPAKHLYDLPDSSWVARAEWRCVGDWLNAYNGKAELSSVSDVIAKYSGWSAGDVLLFVQSGSQVIRLRFLNFLKCWPGMLAAFDDGPLLMSEKCDSKPVFRFVPLGRVVYASVSRCLGC